MDLKLIYGIALVFFTIYETTRSILIEEEYKKIINKTWNSEKDILSVKNESKMNNLWDKNSMIISCSIAACLSELAACIVRVPSEVIKQRTQAGQYGSSWEAFVDIFPGKKDRRYGGIYCGFVSTIIRDIPFAVIQFPLWEIIKQKMTETSNIKILSNISFSYLGDTTLSSTLQSAISGSIASSIAAALTTPLDVIKTRTILSQTVLIYKKYFYFYLYIYI
uniref:Mitochondrial S-adenosylmethionine carrier n=1 Tax=Pneumocystis carinii TaxID=4754 RepID=C1JZX5_PNECA|nr:mitochondrial S-adenosylmethionine carrier [Pneumocystis carinii]